MCRLTAHAEKRLLRELATYVRGLMTMQQHTSNMVYVVSLGTGHNDWSGSLTPVQIVTDKNVYFCPIGNGYPKEPPNYLGFRWHGRLQQTRHVDGYEVFTVPCQAESLLRPTFPPGVETWEQTRQGLAVLVHGDGLDLLGGANASLALNGLRSQRGMELAVDAAHDRLFVLTRAGTVAEVERIGSSKPSLSYHEVQLAPPTGDGTLSGAAALDSRTLALWGSDFASGSSVGSPFGLNFIDTRSWTTRVVDPEIGAAFATGDSVVGWTPGASTGVAVYARGGFQRFRALVGHEVRWVVASGNYAYVLADCATTRIEIASCLRFSVDLRSGRVTGPLRSRARVILGKWAWASGGHSR